MMESGTKEGNKGKKEMDLADDVVAARVGAVAKYAHRAARPRRVIIARKVPQPITLRERINFTDSKTQHGTTVILRCYPRRGGSESRSLESSV